MVNVSAFIDSTVGILGVNERANRETDSGLSTKYYDRVCPKVLPTIKRMVEDAVAQERRMGASLLRLHFHDCFVNGCDASVLLDQTSTIDTEKNAGANVNSARGFEVIDRIKSEVNKICGRPVVSCADILTIAARDSVVAHLWLDEEDLVVLSGAHTPGFAQCFTFRDHIYNDRNIDPAFADHLRTICPRVGGDSNLAPLDPTPSSFDTKYFNNLMRRRGVLKSDQVLFNNGETGELVSKYNEDKTKFFKDFAKSMIKMGKINLLTGNRGQVRDNYRRVNSQ
uniref:Peroxidase n=1 Tax=Tanacetum cinerariifolium TaxID=118510 RepID=A0A6L2KS79_TANCI|nr:heme peroxidase [Tanacetum cinerariifolium]